MAKVGWALITSAVYNNQNNLPVLEHPLATILLENIPNNFSFSLAFCLIDLKVSEKYNLKIEILGPGNSPPLLNGNVGIDHNQQGKFESTSFFSDINLQNFRFNSFGEYRVVLTLDDNEPHTIYFDVRKKDE